MSSLPPAGLSSDNYAGLVFWDAETWMFPSILADHPDIARAITDSIYSVDASALNLPGCTAYTFALRAYEPFIRPPFAQFSELVPPGYPLPPAPSGRENPAETAFDFLTGSGGFLQSFLYGFSGFRWRTDRVWLNPKGTSVMPTRRPDLVPTSDLARCRPVTASSYLAGDDPVAAVDGTTATVWTATSKQAQLQVDLGMVSALSQVKVNRANAFQRADNGTFGYTVEASADRKTWRTVATVPTRSGDEADQIPLPKGTSARYIRLVFPGGAGMDPPTVAELAVDGTRG